MATKTANKRLQSFSDEARLRAKKLKAIPSLLPSKKEKTFTKRELEEIQSVRRLRYNDLLNSARNEDMAAVLVLPNSDQFEIPMSRPLVPWKFKLKFWTYFIILKSERKTSHSNFPSVPLGPR
ncbi:hypothetical protein BGX20_005900 [Mortierella sp. AD010]|nr:hypothetical protein BGX20_005900 [Mortierella sp. AD010]